MSLRYLLVSHYEGMVPTSSYSNIKILRFILDIGTKRRHIIINCIYARVLSGMND